MYIKLDSDMNLVITANEPIYRGDNLAKKIVYLIPMTVGDIDMLTATVYLSYIRADGTADIVLLPRMEEPYNEAYYQYTLPVTNTLSRYAGEICTWLQIYSGSPKHPTIAKSGECMMQVIASKNMDEYISDRNLSLIYMMQRHMEDKIEQAETALGTRIEQTNAAMEDGLAKKADNVVFNEETGTLQLMSGDTPIGDTIIIRLNDEAVSITDAAINESGELVLAFSNGTVKNLGNVVGNDGSVYVPHIDAHKVLTFTIETEPTEPPEPIDLVPSDDWSSIDGSEVKTDYVWETL